MRKFCDFFTFWCFLCGVRLIKRLLAFLRLNSKELDFAVTSLKSTLLGRLPLMSEKVYFL
ncbi:hypothetical protein C2S04_04945 [Helicobacter pylori]|nr:hypothetical protein C2S04_04945 [Helicobacter pylori]